MKQMIQRMREEKGGFTLAELLIVVAIVAVLVAIAIPVFTGQLAEAQKQTDAANIRGGYATVSVEVLDDNLTADTWYGLNADGSVVEKADGDFACQGESGTGGMSVGGSTVTWEKGNKIYYTYSAANEKITPSTSHS
ncbi:MULTISPECIES: prepilin-type N-terminal cleavage/methylation domain-containing protein [Gordonibacter]|jgi:type IV pilus assembly protein PilA|uniref:Prepilin-type N-terminal cleavage/methylation domain n=2 Tax=Gordonibacter pamelaeae TaxID=471189 RepID=D6E852_9ACTN|nr:MULTISPECIES: prepilin-type N-terminal cleavage/methylation domain-containing protein [Gordonibacter]MCB7086279.1 prepilin-type N-terminal cleavage/methylation domain-containing protein [Gordonibacter urolithinfaciens]RDB66914.1 prepilin-type N-terminal cleavage/methylation domain-containing protein [Gordonibacter pamelaeae]CBL03899.1 prepilin-type N-terminal cleavage/methylation domain [Gordonibacter pamelaeae 7-10-1-b]